jgi:4-hydroxy-tetrahydrodipicolinate reductase
VTVGLDSLIDIGIGRPAAPADVAPVDEGGVPGQVARATESFTDGR